jgi:hypothetical protein
MAYQKMVEYSEMDAEVNKAGWMARPPGPNIEMCVIEGRKMESLGIDPRDYEPPGMDFFGYGLNLAVFSLLPNNSEKYWEGQQLKGASWLGTYSAAVLFTEIRLRAARTLHSPVKLRHIPTKSLLFLLIPAPPLLKRMQRHLHNPIQDLPLATLLNPLDKFIQNP